MKNHLFKILVSVIASAILLVLVIGSLRIYFENRQVDERTRRNTKYFLLQYSLEGDRSSNSHRWDCVQDVKSIPNGKYTYLEWTSDVGVRSTEPEAKTISVIACPTRVTTNSGWCEP